MLWMENWGDFGRGLHYFSFRLYQWNIIFLLFLDMLFSKISFPRHPESSNFDLVITVQGFYVVVDVLETFLHSGLGWEYPPIHNF
jgi:hypothetical protein